MEVAQNVLAQARSSMSKIENLQEALLTDASRLENPSDARGTWSSSDRIKGLGLTLIVAAFSTMETVATSFAT